MEGGVSGAGDPQALSPVSPGSWAPPGAAGELLVELPPRRAARRAQLSHHVAAKHAIQGLTSAWAFELAEFAINVNCVAPATIRPGDGQGSGIVLGLAGEVDMTAAAGYMPGPKWRTEMQNITDAVLFLASDNADRITGHILRVDAGQGAR